MPPRPDCAHSVKVPHRHLDWLDARLHIVEERILSQKYGNLLADTPTLGRNELAIHINQKIKFAVGTLGYPTNLLLALQ